MKYLVLFFIPVLSFGKTYKSNFQECMSYTNSLAYRTVKSKKVSFIKYRCDKNNKRLNCLIYKDKESKKIASLKMMKTSDEGNKESYFDQKSGAKIQFSKKSKKIILTTPFKIEKESNYISILFCRGNLK